MRTLESVELEGDVPKQECLVADCGELPSDADLSQIATYTTEVRCAVPPLH